MIEAEEQVIENTETEAKAPGKHHDEKREVDKGDGDAEAGAEKTDSSGAAKHADPTKGEDQAIEKDPDRKDKMPSNILEKGIIYFFTRGRVGIEDPESVSELQRTYFVLRPLPKDAKIGEGAMPESSKNRLIALPKKVFPKSGRDRFMAFVEKANVSMGELKEDFFQGSEYDTKTAGTRQTPPVTLIGEGVYALTATGRTSHLVYMLTVPRELGDVQHDMGIREKGSFITSLKNPTKAGPANARLPEGPEFPKDILEDFGNYAWIPVHRAEYLDYANAQILLIGEGEDKFEGAVEGTDKDRHEGKKTPGGELEKLEEEDQVRVEHLHGDETVFDDLHVSKREYPDVMTTW